jgi:hypothetical protein
MASIAQCLRIGQNTIAHSSMMNSHLARAPVY